MPALFTSFDDAWRWFEAGGELVPMAEWRERFTRGRGQLLSFEVPIGETALGTPVVDLQDELAESIDGLVLFEREMLHISVVAVGFQVIATMQPGDILRQDAERVAAKARSLIGKCASASATVGPVNVFPDALILEVHDDGALCIIRDALATLVDDAFGITAAQYLPHVTIAMFRSPDVAAPLRHRLPVLRQREPWPITIRNIELARWWFTGHDDDALPERDPVRTYPLRR
jgi:2'-5' RNA ligase superfamily protein